MQQGVLNNIFNFFIKYRYTILIYLIFIFAFIFRLECLMMRENWIDEIDLACNFIENKGFLWVFKPLLHKQMAPPLFLLLTKVMTIIFQGAEISYRIIPFVSSIISIPVFYILSEKFLKTQRAIIFANFLYAANFALIRWSSEFKQYSSDVLIFMLILLFLNKQNFQDINFKKGLKLGIIFAVLFFISQPTIFLLFGFIVYNLILNIKNRKNFFKLCLIPILPLFFVFLYKFLTPKVLNEFMYDWWLDGFITYGNILKLTKQNLDFFFYNIKCLILLAPLIFAGFLFSLFDKNKINRIFLISLMGVFLAGIFKFYPYLHRLILFLFPFFIIFISKIFDFKISNKCFDKTISIGIIAFVFIFLFSFSCGFICKNRYPEIAAISRARSISLILKDNFDNKKDIIIVPQFNKNFYTFYKNCLRMKINDNKIIEIKDFNEKAFKEVFDKTDKNLFYWVYIPSYHKNTVAADALIKWIKNNSKTFYEIKFGIVSHIFKVKFIKQL